MVFMTQVQAIDERTCLKPQEDLKELCHFMEDQSVKRREVTSPFAHEDQCQCENSCWLVEMRMSEGYDATIVNPFTVFLDLLFISCFAMRGVEFQKILLRNIIEYPHARRARENDIIT